MITGFEEFSYELTDIEESKIYPKFVEAWSNKPYEQFITMKEMLEGVQNWIEKQNILTKKGKIYKITGPRMRKIIHKARVSGKLHDMIANSKGYFKTQDVEKIRKFIQSCRERANSFKEVADSLETYNFER